MRTIERIDNKLIVKFSGSDFTTGLAFCKQMKLKFHPVEKYWYTDNLTLYGKFKAVGYTDPADVPEVEEAYTPIATKMVDYTQKKLVTVLLPDEIRPYQIDTVKFALHRPRTILGLPPGAGKSLVGTVYARHIDTDKYTVILCPASLKVLWQRELFKWGGIHAEVLEGLTPYTPSPLSEYLIINYDVLGCRDPVALERYKQACAIAKASNKPVPKNSVPIIGWANYLVGKVGCLLVDESQYLGDTGSIRVKQFKLMSKTIPNIVFLSGTPIRHRPAKFFAQLQTCDGRTFSSERAYNLRYCDPKSGFRGMVYNGATHVEELHDKVKSFVYYRSKEEILPDLPIKNWIVTAVDGNKDFTRQDAEMKRLQEAGNLSRVEEMAKLRELARSAYVLKRQTIFDTVDELLENDEKVVLVAFHQAVIKDLVDRYKCEYINGEVDPSKRQGIVDRFEEGKHKVIVLQVQAGGVGFSILTSRTMVFAEAHFIHSEVLQVSDRLHRMTSTWPQVDYHMPVVADSIEEGFMKSIIEGSQVASAILTGKSKSLLDSPERLVSDKGDNQ